MNRFFALIRKDLCLEWRTAETISLMIFLALLSATVMSFGVQSAFLSQETIARIFPALVWVLFFITASLAVGKSFEHEAQGEALEGLLLTGVSAPLIYLARVLVSSLIIFLGQLAGIGFLALLLNVNVRGFGGEFLLICALASIGYSALATLFSAVSYRSRLRQLLLPLIILPLLFPLFLASLELTTILVDRGQLEIGSTWFTLLIAVDVLYLVLGINLFEFVVRE